MSPSAAITRSSRRPHVTVRRQRRAQAQERQALVEHILDHGTTLAAQAAAAAAVTQARLTDDELQAWRQDLQARLDRAQQHPEQNLAEVYKLRQQIPVGTV